MGLCFGGGQIALGVWAFAAGFVILVGLKRFEGLMPQKHHGTLTVSIFGDEAEALDVERLLADAGVSTRSPSIDIDDSRNGNKTLGWRIQWSGKHIDGSPPPVIRQLAAHPQIRRLEFTKR